MTAGVAAAVPTAASGLNDWSDTQGPESRVGLVLSEAFTIRLAVLHDRGAVAPLALGALGWWASVSLFLVGGTPLLRTPDGVRIDRYGIPNGLSAIRAFSRYSAPSFTSNMQPSLLRLAVDHVQDELALRLGLLECGRGAFGLDKSGPCRRRELEVGVIPPPAFVLDNPGGAAPTISEGAVIMQLK